MSGRSAIVRRKITEAKGDQGSATQGRAQTSHGAADAHGFGERVPTPIPGSQNVQGRDRNITGVPTTNARFLRFSEPARKNEATAYYRNGTGSPSIISPVSRRESIGQPLDNGPLEDYAYARARRSAIKTEDVSGIEKSGLRSMLDKKSEEVRKGIAKTFTFHKKKDKRGGEGDEQATDAPSPSPMAAAMRPPLSGNASVAELDAGRDWYDDQQVNRAASLSVTRNSQPPEEPGHFPSPPPTSDLPPVPPNATAPPIKRWLGAGRGAQRWNKLRRDPELWDPNGDVLIFLAHKSQTGQPNPSFRLSSHIIEATESRHLMALLQPCSSEEGGQQQQRQQQQQQQQQQQLRPQAAGLAHYGQPTPPVSRDASLAESGGRISYEMHFPPPSSGTKLDQLRHHITTRNVFALLCNASLVGLSLYQALTDLLLRLEQYMGPDIDTVGAILDYVSTRNMDDVRNDAESAVGLLAWSEGTRVRWEPGWRESFLHCAGMYDRLDRCADYRHVAPITRGLLERANLEMQLRVQTAEERLAAFEYSDMWPSEVAIIVRNTGLVAVAPAKAAVDRLQSFLLQYYRQKNLGQWPPLQAFDANAVVGTAHGDGEELWLNRTITQRLQRDFGALYDYLVNRDIVWDGSEARARRKWLMVSESGDEGFDPDTPDLPMTDMLIEFDNKMRYPHIPHPYPLVPESVPPPPSSGAASNGVDRTVESGRSSSGKPGAPPDRRIQLAYAEATNLCSLGPDFAHSDLIDAFGKFEKSDPIGDTDPATARRGRWLLIYGILQTLATVSVDTPGVCYSDNVPYHLSPRLKGARLPPWKTRAAYGSSSTSCASATFIDEAAHELSHCWMASHAWSTGSSAGHDGSAHEYHLVNSFPHPPATMSGGTTRRDSTLVTDGYGAGEPERRLPGGASSETDSVARVIRDFDELDLIDDAIDAIEP